MMEAERTYKVYMLIFPNGKRYIGMTGKSLEKRFNGGRGYRHCQKVWNAIKKFGWESVRHEVLLDGLTKQEAEREEIALIALYNTTENGYNIEHGGNCSGTHSIETRMKISAANKGKKHRTPTAEERRRQSEKMRGELGSFFGKHHTQETRQAQSERMRGNKYNAGNHHTEQFKAWKSRQMREKYSDGNHPRCKRVISWCDGGGYDIFTSLRYAAECAGVSPSLLCTAIKTGRVVGGSVWGYND